MLEDSRMDKKSQLRSQSQPKTTAVDCKKNSEPTNKPWPRNHKKREGAGNASKNEPNRKNAIVSKGRGQPERRSRARETGLVVLGGTEVPGLADNEPELGSVFEPGSKKQNLNHLLNFVYTPRGLPDRKKGPVRPHFKRMFHPHNQDLYLQANCQFVVKEDGDYSANLLDPDVAIKWDLIEEIVVRSTGRAECPICLGTPVAGRVGRCGHVHCWPCALHYEASHDRKPPPCPVCAAPFRVDQMKPARMVQWQAPSEEVSMRLVRRLRGSTNVELAPPRGYLTESTVASVLPYEEIDKAPFGKIFKASKVEVRGISKRERNELEYQILEEIDTSEITYFEKALEVLKVQEEHLKELSQKNSFAVFDDIPTVFEKQEEMDPANKIDWFDVKDDIDNIQNQLDDFIIDDANDTDAAFNLSDSIPECEIEFPLMEESIPDTETFASSEVLTEIDKENKLKYFYFYQAEDGQQVFLHGVNVRLLCASWGLLAAAPTMIRGRVLRREASSLTEQIRKHMPCAAHLPLHCPFDVVELDLQPPYVTPAAVATFSDELGRRARARVRFEREERRRERAYRQAMEGPPKPDLFSDTHFPPTSPPNFLPLESLQAPAEQPSTSTMSQPSSGLSFAKMAGAGGAWRIRTPRPPTPPSPAENSPPAPRTLSLSDAIEAALHASPAPANQKRQSKKKGKQKVLFATGMQRAA